MGDEPSIPLGPFPQTEWPLVLRAGGGRRDRRALGELLRLYLPALKAHLVLKRGIGRHAANDLVQGFVADKIVERDLLGHVTGAGGRFRTFLLKALGRYVISQARREGAKKRSPGPLLSIDEAGAPIVVSPEAADPFDVAWAREVLAEALRRMRVECDTPRRSKTWNIFECRVLAPCLEGAAPTPYEHLAKRFGFQSPTQAANALITAKRMFSRTLRSVVAEYAGDQGEVDDEIAQLREILSRAGA